MSEILKITDLWGGYQEGVDILCGVSIKVQQGESVGIIGLNGSGKSTFGRAIMNMIPYRRGDMLFEGKDITSLTTSQLSHRGISIMQQGSRVFRNLSVWHNLQLAMSKQSPNALEKLKDIIPILQRPKRELQRMMADKLSGGQKQQLSLAMTLATNPLLVILDEPSAGLSPKAVEEMYAILNDVREQFGIVIILIEQNIAKAVEFCDSIVMLRQGVFYPIHANQSFNEIENILFNK